MHWKTAPDARMLGTLDWMNDACEAKLDAVDRNDRTDVYEALMSPTTVVFPGRGRPGRRQARPISLLITADWVLIGTRRRWSRIARVRKVQRAATSPALGGVSFTFATDHEVTKIKALIPEVTADRSDTLF